MFNSAFIDVWMCSIISHPGDIKRKNTRICFYPCILISNVSNKAGITLIKISEQDSMKKNLLISFIKNFATALFVLIAAMYFSIATQLVCADNKKSDDIQSSATKKIAHQTPLFPGLDIVYLRPEILTEEAADQYLADIKSWGASSIFLETGYDNKVLYPSKIFPSMDGKDWLKIYCDKAKKIGLKVHLWAKICFWVHQKENLDSFPILKEHPDWIDLNKKGEIVSETGSYEQKFFIFINPAHPEVQKAICDYIKELCAYDIEGISIDYIRFKACDDNPETWFGFNKYSCDRFITETGLDPRLIAPDKSHGGKFMRWVNYNEKVIEECVGKISETIDTEEKESGKKIILSASPFTGYISGKSSKFQNWKPWDDKKYIDLWLPMCMSIDMKMLQKEISDIKNLNLQAPYCPVVYPNKHGSLHPPLADHYEVLNKCGIQKFAVFQYRQIKEDASFAK